jgi:hypothetical protein
MTSPSETLPKSYRTFILFFLVSIFSVFLFSLKPPAALQETGIAPQEADEPENIASREITVSDIRRGERLFQGLLPLGPGVPSCASCHNTAQIDTFNWNPSAIDIALLYEGRSVADLNNAVMDPVSVRMMEAHEGYVLSEQELFMIKAYLDNLAHEGIRRRPVITSLLIFMLVILIVAGAIADLAVFRKVRYRLVHLTVILAGGFFILSAIVHEAVSIGRSHYYEPDQPIKFSHRVHAHDNRTDCLYCHSIAEYSHSAGIPSVSHCMNCHIIVRDGTHSGRFEISKIVGAFENQMPVRWIRIHKLPDHVFFSHSVHVNAGRLECIQCHGEVEQTHRLMQVEDLSMGWCLDCHRTTGVDFLENEFYSIYTRLQEDIRNGRAEAVTSAEVGGTKCMKCHY